MKTIILGLFLVCKHSIFCVAQNVPLDQRKIACSRIMLCRIIPDQGFYSKRTVQENLTSLQSRMSLTTLLLKLTHYQDMCLAPAPCKISHGTYFNEDPEYGISHTIDLLTTIHTINATLYVPLYYHIL